MMHSAARSSPCLTLRERKLINLACLNAEQAIAREVPRIRRVSEEIELRYFERGAERMAELDRMIRQMDGEFPFRFGHKRLKVLERIGAQRRVQYDDGAIAILSHKSLIPA